jgi:hypothetical protein
MAMNGWRTLRTEQERNPIVLFALEDEQVLRIHWRDSDLILHRSGMRIKMEVRGQTNLNCSQTRLCGGFAPRAMNGKPRSKTDALGQDVQPATN